MADNNFSGVVESLLKGMDTRSEERRVGKECM